MSKALSLFLLVLLLMSCTERTTLDEALIILSNTSISQTASAGSLIARVYTPDADEPGAVSLLPVNDAQAFRLEDDKLFLETLTGQPRYAITLAWQGSSGLQAEQSFSLELVSENLIVPAERLGGVAFMGQLGADFRALNPSRRLDLGLYERYYFDAEGFQVEVCKASDAVTAVMVEASHTSAGLLRTAEGLGFDSPLTAMLDRLGETGSITFAGYEVYVYDYPKGELSFTYLTTDPGRVQSISISQRYCPQDMPLK